MNIQTLNKETLNHLGIRTFSPSMALAGLMSETGELADAIARNFKWKKTKPGDKEISDSDIALEIADVMVYLCQIADFYDIDIEEAHRIKCKILKERYDV